jgi:hypothetical protein
LPEGEPVQLRPIALAQGLCHLAERGTGLAVVEGAQADYCPTGQQ